MCMLHCSGECLPKQSGVPTFNATLDMCQHSQGDDPPRWGPSPAAKPLDPPWPSGLLVRGSEGTHAPEKHEVAVIAGVYAVQAPQSLSLKGYAQLLSDLASCNIFFKSSLMAFKVSRASAGPQHNNHHLCKSPEVLLQWTGGLNGLLCQSIK